MKSDKHICIKQEANADGEDCAKAILAEVDKLERSAQ